MVLRSFKPVLHVSLLALAIVVTASSAGAAEPRATVPPAAPEPQFSPEHLDFFKHDVAPILQAHCLSCHGGEPKIQGELRLTSRELILKGGESGPAASLEAPDDSLLLSAIRYDSLEMPPKGKLPQAQIDILARWVKLGLPWSPDALAVKPHSVPQVDEAARNFWAFRPVARPELPSVKRQDWVRNPIDAFVLHQLEGAHMEPAAPASKTSLLRRVYYAVTGLPPKPTEVEAFLADTSPDAYEQVVDRLLATPEYGQHWGRHWLDLVRYAETNSFERDGIKPNAWKYRDYVIQAFNDDKPYDQFIREQLAGDELEPLTREGLIATGYYRLGVWDDEPADRDLAYYDQLDDIVSTTGQTFLGLTIGCARCHDHKIDPFPQQDYYRFLAFFHGINSYGNGNLALLTIDDAPGADLGLPTASRPIRSVKATDDDLARTAGRPSESGKKLAAISAQLAAIENQAAAGLVAGEKDDFAHEQNRLPILTKRVGEIISPADLERYRALQAERDVLTQSRETVFAVMEAGAQPRETFVLARGNPHSPLEEKLTPAFPSVLQSADRAQLLLPSRESSASTSGRRQVAAAWIADRANPLTARVLVNRLWQYNFGRGLVRSSSNFGYQGTPPTHPELLDYLASEFTVGGLRLKALQRLILTSNTFRMSSQPAAIATAKDPENDRLSHFDLRRLSAEEIRDSILWASGNLNLTKTSGPSVYPVIPAEVLAGQSRPGEGWGQSTPEEQAARSVFVFVKRSLAVPLLAAFDAPDPDLPCAVRFATTQPSQALGMLNSPFLEQQSRVFAQNIEQLAASDVRQQVDAILRRVLQRTPSDAEVARGLAFIEKMQSSENLSAHDALARFCLLSLNLTEFLYLD